MRSDGIYSEQRLAAAGVGALKAAGEMEQSNIAFTTMLGSASKAKAWANIPAPMGVTSATGASNNTLRNRAASVSVTLGRVGGRDGVLMAGC